MIEVYLTAHALTLVPEMIVSLIFYSNLHSLLTLGFKVVIDNRVGDIVLALIVVVVREPKNSILTKSVFNLVNKGRKAYVVGLSLIVKSIVLDL